MPRRHHPQSLRQASLRNIVCHFDDYWCAERISSLLEDSEHSGVFTPFQYFGDDTTQEIIDMLHKRELLKPHHFQLLLHSNIRRLNLGACGIFQDQNSVIKSLGIRCQNLTHLKMDGLRNVQSDLLSALLTNLPHIISLDLNCTRLDANRDALKIISENCPNLLDLNVDECGLWEPDFIYLCKPPKHTESLPKLRKLSYDFRLLSPDTVVNLLKNHPNLQYLGPCACIDHAFDQMYGEEFQSLKDVPHEWFHNLLQITIDGRVGGKCRLSEEDRLDLTFQCCPFLTDLELFNLAERESFDNVSKLKHLKTLYVFTHNRFRNQTFSTFMAPVLIPIGSNLTSLKCRGFDEVSLIQIGKWCNSLESLELDRIGLISKAHGTNPLPYFTNLRVLSIKLMRICEDTLTAEEADALEANELSTLLQHATEIHVINLFCVKNLTDRSIAKANANHGFRNLKKCSLTECSPISVESIRELLRPDNPLEELRISGCRNITRQDMALVRHEVKLRQLNVCIESDYYDPCQSVTPV